MTLNEFLKLDYPIITIPYHGKHIEGYKSYLSDIPAIESIDETIEGAVKDLEDIKKEWFYFAVEENIDIPLPTVKAELIKIKAAESTSAGNAVHVI